MSKSYTWKDIKSSLLNSFQKTSHILFSATIGSVDLYNDIDILFFKKKNSSTRNFYKDIHFIFDELNSYLDNNFSAKSVCFPQYEKEFLFCSNIDKNDVSFHVLTYCSMNQFKHIWTLWMEEHEEPFDIINSSSLLFGNKEDFFDELKFLFSAHYANLYDCLWAYDRIHSSFPDELVLDSLNHNLNYVVHKRLGLEKISVNSIDEVRLKFYEVCDIVDFAEQKKSNNFFDGNEKN